MSNAELRGRAIETRQQKLKLREAEIAVQNKQIEDEIKLRMAELKAIKHQRDLKLAAQKQQREDEMKLRMTELEALKHQRDTEVELRKAEAVANQQRFAEEQAYRLKQETRRIAKKN